MSHRHEIRVRYAEVDRMGVVHHSMYPVYFEEARTAMMRSIGQSYADLEREGFLLPLTDYYARFIRGPRYDDVLVVESRITACRGVRLRVDYRVFEKESGELMATGHTVHACTNVDLRPRRLPPGAAEKFSAAVEPEEGEDPGGGSRPKSSGGRNP
jgi:acyl-CoA thioester hydrolase